MKYLNELIKKKKAQLEYDYFEATIELYKYDKFYYEISIYIKSADIFYQYYKFISSSNVEITLPRIRQNIDKKKSFSVFGKTVFFLLCNDEVTYPESRVARGPFHKFEKLQIPGTSSVSQERMNNFLRVFFETRNNKESLDTLLYKEGLFGNNVAILDYFYPLIFLGVLYDTEREVIKREIHKFAIDDESGWLRDLDVDSAIDYVWKLTVAFVQSNRLKLDGS